MQQRRLALLLLKPSIFSVLMSTLVAIAILAATNWSYLTKSLFYNYFFENAGITAAFESRLTDLATLTEALSSQKYSYEVVVLAAASAIGLIVYLVLQSVQRFLSRLLEDYVEVDEASSLRRKVAAADFSLQWIVRIMSVVLFAVYTVFFVSYVLSFSVLLSISGIEKLLTPEGSLYNVLAITVLVAGLHIHVILMRFMMLRPRLFGGKTAIATALYSDR